MNPDQPRPRKTRLDELLVQRDLAPDLDKALRIIMSGSVRSGDQVLDKPGFKVMDDIPLQVIDRTCPYVSWGGMKLAGALDQFSLPVAQCRCLDIGASTGGFTHVLLLRGASSVVALDVAYGFIDQRLRNDPRVTVMERTNFRLLPEQTFSQPFEIITIDVSFISLKQIITKALSMLTPAGNILALIKPQFEAARDEVERGGLVTNPAVHVAVIRRLQEAFLPMGLYLQRLHDIRRASPRKNREFLSWWNRTPSGLTGDEILTVVHTDRS